MDPEKKAADGLHQQSLLKKCLEMKAGLEKKLGESDDQLVHLEAEVAVKQINIQEFERDLHLLKIELGGLEERLASGRNKYKELERQKLMLKDFEGLLNGSLFNGSVAGACFFIQELKEFAYGKGVGEFEIGEEIKKSLDGFSMAVNGKVYWYVKGADDNYYFYPEEIS